MKLLLFFNPDRFLWIGPRDQPGREVLVAAAELVVGPPDDDAAVGLEAGMGAPKRVGLRVGKAQIGNLRFSYARHSIISPCKIHDVFAVHCSGGDPQGAG
jgi:hypothetical protein